MGFDVHLNVVMPCYTNDEIAKIAKEHLDLHELKIPSNDEWFKSTDFYDREISWYAANYLADLVRRTGENPGPKGGLSLWGTVGNFINPEDFVDDLQQFWFDCFDCDGGPCRFEHIIVFYEREQSEQANCYEIYLERTTKDNSKSLNDLKIKHHQLPFTWMQF